MRSFDPHLERHGPLGAASRCNRDGHVAIGLRRSSRNKVASIAVASIMAKAMPMQMRPAPNGKYW